MFKSKKCKRIKKEGFGIVGLKNGDGKIR